MKRLFVPVLAVCLIALLPRLAFAHAHLVASTPAPNAAVQGPDIPFDLRFNSRVDPQRSTLTLVTADGHTRRLSADKQSSEASLHTHAQLSPGSYVLRWQALSTDGHITRGEIPFSVK
jgi:methionine-rich copper-binding protein CopC